MLSFISRSAGVALFLTTVILAAPLAAQGQTERRWFVDRSPSSTGDGSASAPFHTLAEAAAAAGEGDVIVVRANAEPYRGGIALRTGQSLVGEGGAAIITSSASSEVIRISDTSDVVTIADVTIRPAASSAGIVVRGAAAVTLHNVRVEQGGAALVVRDAGKLVVSGDSSLESIDAPAADIIGAGLDVVLRSLSASGETLAHGLILQRTTGRFTVEGKDGLEGSGGTIEGASTSAIAAAEGSNLTFRNMRLLRSAGVNGAEPVACGGDLATGSNERCSAAVHLVKVDGVVLERLTIDGSGQAGIVAHEVSGLALLETTVRNAGNELFEHGLILEEIGGEFRIVGTTVEKSASRNLMLHNSRGRLTLTIERSSFTDTGASHGQQGVLVTAVGDATVDLHVRDSVFARSLAAGVEAVGADDARLRVQISGSTFEENGIAISLATTHAARLDYVIADNSKITAAAGPAINVYLGSPSSGVISGAINRNVIGVNGQAGSGAGCASCSGIVLSATGQGELIADVSGNVVQQVGASAIHAGATQGSARLQLTATANLLRDGNGSAPAIHVQSGARAGDGTAVCADIGGPGAKANKIEGVWDSNGAIHLHNRFANARFLLAGLTGGKSDVAAAAAVSNRNGGAVVRAVLRPDSAERGFEPVERCTMPSLTP